MNSWTQCYQGSLFWSFTVLVYSCPETHPTRTPAGRCRCGCLRCYPAVAGWEDRSEPDESEELGIFVHTGTAALNSL